MRTIITITKKISVEDIPAIQRLLYETWHDTYAGLLPQKVIQAVTSTWHSSTALKRDLENINVYCAAAKTHQDAIIGFITAHINKDTMRVTRLYVLPSHQKQGIGQQLMVQANNAFPGIQSITLEIEAKNHKARKFYASLGFKEIQHTGNFNFQLQAGLYNFRKNVNVS